jgi:hypothetical protein
MANRYSRRKRLRRPLVGQEPAEPARWKKLLIIGIVLLLVIAFGVVRFGRMLR